MSIRFQLAALIYMMVQAVVFGIGIIVVMSTPLDEQARQLIPYVVVISAAISIPLSWALAPGLRTKFTTRMTQRPNNGSLTDEPPQTQPATVTIPV